MATTISRNTDVIQPIREPQETAIDCNTAMPLDAEKLRQIVIAIQQLTRFGS